MTRVKLKYTEEWQREIEIDLEMNEVREWAAEPGQDASTVEVTEAVLVDYLRSDFDYSGADSWHPGGAGMADEGYEFVGLEVDRAEVVS